MTEGETNCRVHMQVCKHSFLNPIPVSRGAMYKLQPGYGQTHRLKWNTPKSPLLVFYLRPLFRHLFDWSSCEYLGARAMGGHLGQGVVSFFSLSPRKYPTHDQAQGWASANQDVRSYIVATYSTDGHRSVACEYSTRCE